MGNEQEDPVKAALVDQTRRLWELAQESMSIYGGDTGAPIAHLPPWEELSEGSQAIVYHGPDTRFSTIQPISPTRRNASRASGRSGAVAFQSI